MALVESTLPLRARNSSGDLAPVDLRLRSRGRYFAPANAYVKTRLGKRSTDGVRFPGAGGRLAVRLAAPRSALGVDTAGKVFYPNVARDEDLLIAPLTTGVEYFTLLRSRRSRQRLRLRFDLPPGAYLRPAGGRRSQFEIIRGREILATISQPLASDAAGTEVPVRARASGSLLELDVEHRSRDVRYPLMIDPIIQAGVGLTAVNEQYNVDQNGQPFGQSESFAGWTAYPTTNNFAQWVGNGINEWGLNVASYAGAYYPNADFREWLWQAYRDSYIERADFSRLANRSADPGASCVFTGLYSTRDFAWEPQTWADAQGNRLTTPARWPRYECGQISYRYTAMQAGVQTTPGYADDAEGTPGNVAAFGMQMSGSGVRASYGWTTMNGSTIWTYDRDRPRIVNPSPGPSGWHRGGTATKTFSATDDDANGNGVRDGADSPRGGLGIYQVYLAAPGNPFQGQYVTPAGQGTGQAASGCTGDRVRRCPVTASASFSYSLASMPEGSNTVQATASDALFKTATATDTVKIDRTKPRISIGPNSPLYDNRNGTNDRRLEGINDTSAALQVQLDDPPGANGTTQRAGIRSMEVFVGGRSVKQQSFTCPGGQCNSSETVNYTLDVEQLVADRGDGDYDVRVIATDDAGNTADELTWQVTVDRRGDIYAAEELTGDQAAAGDLVSQEWARIATKTARVEGEDSIITRTDVPCTDGQPDGPSCPEARYRTLDSQLGTGIQDTFARYRGASSSDTTIEQVSGLLNGAEVVGGSQQPDEQGPLVSALAPWQPPPPGHGATYSRYTVQADTTRNTGSPDPATQEFPDETQASVDTYRIWIDRTTKMPLKTTAISGSEETTTYWRYERQRKAVSDYPSDYFRVAAPDQWSSASSSTGYQNQPVGQVTDSDTGGQFTPYYLGPTPSGGGDGVLCLEDVGIFELNEPVPAGEIADDPEAMTQPLVKTTRVDASYSLLPSGSPCSPGLGLNLEDLFDVEVASFASGSEAAQAYRDAIMPGAQAIELDSADPDRPIGGLLDFSLNGNRTAYVLPRDDGGTVALMEIGSTTVVVRASVAKAGLPALLSQLVSR